MSKPEDISQEAWNAADDMAFYDPSTEDRDGSLNRYKLREAIARAILSAEKRGEDREREACAQVVRRSTNANMAASTRMVLYRAEAAIRNRTATQETT